MSRGATGSLQRDRLTTTYHTAPVGVIMAARNAETTIRGALHSILHQTVPPSEVIVVDDASSDKTSEVVRQFASPIVRLTRLEGRVGRAAARNIAIDQSHSELLAIADADDISLPWRLEHTVDILLRTESVAVGGQVAVFEDDPLKAFLAERWPTSPQEILDVLARGTMPLAHPTVLMRCDAVKAISGYNERLSWSEDFDLVYRLSRTGRLAASPEVVALYRQRAYPTWLYMWNTHRARRLIAGTQAGRSPLTLEVAQAVIGATTDATRSWLRHRLRPRLRCPFVPRDPFN